MNRRLAMHCLLNDSSYNMTCGVQGGSGRRTRDSAEL